jgi:hypothetical protein
MIILLFLPTLFFLFFCSSSSFNSPIQLWTQLEGADSDAMLSHSHSQSYCTTVGLQPISSSWRQAPWDSRQVILFSKWTIPAILLRKILSNEGMGLSYIIAAGPRQLSHSQVWVPRNSCLRFKTPQLGGRGLRIYIP